MGNVTVTNPGYHQRITSPGAPEVIVVREEGPPGERGPSGGAGGLFSYHQTTPASQWNITHNLGRYPEPVLFLDTDPETPVWTDRFYPDTNHISLVLPAPATGWVYL